MWLVTNVAVVIIPETRLYDESILFFPELWKLSEL